MPDKPQTSNVAPVMRTGVMPAVDAEADAEQRREPDKPPTLPEMQDDGATTGTNPIVSEGDDENAEREVDSASGN